MNFEWDEDKNKINLAKHGFNFHDASRIFKLPMIAELDAPEAYGEERWVGIGLLDVRVIVVVFTEPQEDVIRIISIRKALSHERKRYEKYIKNRLG